MPMPMPEKDEAQDDFMNRCMGNDTMNDEFPDEKQRYAVCMGNWKEEKKEMDITKMEKRTFNFSIDAENRGKNEPLIKGHAAVFNERTSIPFWGFDEMVEKNAFAKSIEADDIRALFNHDPNYVLGRNRAGTLKLFEDEKGLAIEINPPATQVARDLMVLIERGDVNQMSFAFEVTKEEWTKGENNTSDLRTLKEVKLYDISAVTYPAYSGTNVAVRSHNRWLKNTEAIIKNDNYRLRLLQRRLMLKIKSKGGMAHG